MTGSVCIHADSQQKLAFVTHHDLHEFHVMPFGLKNALAAFQRWMQVVTDLNPVEGPQSVLRSIPPGDCDYSPTGALLSYLMRDVCCLLRIQKLNTAAYHPLNLSH